VAVALLSLPLVVTLALVGFVGLLAISRVRPDCLPNSHTLGAHRLGAGVGVLRALGDHGRLASGQHNAGTSSVSERIVRGSFEPAEPILGTHFEGGELGLERGEPGVEVVERSGPDDDIRAAAGNGWRSV
jgi:hypothetical protein